MNHHVRLLGGWSAGWSYTSIVHVVANNEQGRIYLAFCLNPGQTPALQQNWKSSEKAQHFKEKHNIYEQDQKDLEIRKDVKIN